MKVEKGADGPFRLRSNPLEWNDLSVVIRTLQSDVKKTFLTQWSMFGYFSDIRQFLGDNYNVADIYRGNWNVHSATNLKANLAKKFLS